MSRKPISEVLQKLALVPNGTPVEDVFSIPSAAFKEGIAHSTLYEGIENGLITGYSAPNLGTNQPLLVVLRADLDAYIRTLRKNKRREAKKLRREEEMVARAAEQG